MKKLKDLIVLVVDVLVGLVGYENNPWQENRERMASY